MYFFFLCLVNNFPFLSISPLSHFIPSFIFRTVEFNKYWISINNEKMKYIRHLSWHATARMNIFLIYLFFYFQHASSSACVRLVIMKLSIGSIKSHNCWRAICNIRPRLKEARVAARVPRGNIILVVKYINFTVTWRNKARGNILTLIFSLPPFRGWRRAAAAAAAGGGNCNNCYYSVYN